LQGKGCLGCVGTIAVFIILVVFAQPIFGFLVEHYAGVIILGFIMVGGFTYWYEKHYLRAIPQITRFIESFYDREAVWPPTSMHIGQDNIKALGRELSEQHGIIFTEDVLRKVVHRQTKKIMDQHFQLSFERLNNLPANPSPKEWANAYVNTFGNNLNFLGYVFRMARKKQPFITGHSLAASIREEMARQGYS